MPAAPIFEPLPPLPTVRSADGRLVITTDTVTVRGQTFLLRELAHTELTPVRWLLWYLIGGMGLAVVLIMFLNNWLRTGPAMLGIALTGLLLAYGQRGTNRLRLARLGREAVHFSLPGEPAPWQQLSRELNRRIQRCHDAAAAEALALLTEYSDVVNSEDEGAEPVVPPADTPTGAIN